MMYSNRSESKSTFNGMPITTRNYMYDNNFSSRYYVNRATNASSNSSQYLPPLAKAIPLNPVKIAQNELWRLPNPQQQQQQQIAKITTLPVIDGKLFTYFPKTKPFMHEDPLVKYDLSLFDTRIFKKMKFLSAKSDVENIRLVKLNGKEYAFDLGDNLILRSLKIDDFERNYLNLLEQLTVVGDEVTKEKFEDRFFEMKSCLNTYYVLVVEDVVLNKIIATGTLVNEQKFIHKASTRGRVEDVVVDEKYRGRKLGKLLLDFAVEMSKLLGCYKVSLECDDDRRGFYELFGFKVEDKQNYLCKRF
jgi:glucosamine-phosphate N-acetyltransferase